ncbi:hypothetical protein HZC53_02720 [Candidatus Uhrbacteria bacterium]|nr:hypothetical protein [Candidatus Uhrbacteria bacterium]
MTSIRAGAKHPKNMAKKTYARHPLVRASRAVKRHAKDHFVPHEGNGHVPHVLRHHTLLGYAAVLFLLKTLLIAAPIMIPAFNAFSSAITPQNIVELTNREREKLNIDTLTTNIKLMNAAQAKADDMLAKQYFSHIGPGGELPWKWITDSGYAYKSAAENLAIHFTEAEDVESGWLASPNHRQNLINPKYSEVGVGVSEGTFHDYPTIIVVQMFGAPKTAQTTGTKPRTDEGRKPKSRSPAGEVAGISIDEGTGSTDAFPATDRQFLQDGYAPQIVTAGAKIRPGDGQVRVSVPIKNADKAWVSLGAEKAQLSQKRMTGVWESTIKVNPDTGGANGDELLVTAIGKDGTPKTAALAKLLPKADTQDMFVPDARFQGCFLLYWLTSGRINFAVNCTFVLTIVFLAISLLIAIVMKRRLEGRAHHLYPHLAHGMSVMLLALLLWKF